MGSYRQQDALNAMVLLIESQLNTNRGNVHQSYAWSLSAQEQVAVQWVEEGFAAEIHGPPWGFAG